MTRTQCVDATSDYREADDVVASLSSKLRMLPGRVAVLMDPVPETFAGSGILMPEGKYHGMYRPDAGTVVASGNAHGKDHVAIPVGTRVAVKPFDGAWFRDEDLSIVPVGRELRLYGVADDWDNSIVGIL